MWFLLIRRMTWMILFHLKMWHNLRNTLYVLYCFQFNVNCAEYCSIYGFSLLNNEHCSSLIVYIYLKLNNPSPNVSKIIIKQCEFRKGVCNCLWNPIFFFFYTRCRILFMCLNYLVYIKSINDFKQEKSSLKIKLYFI